MTEDQVKELIINNLKLKVTYSYNDYNCNSMTYNLLLIYKDEVISSEYLDIDIPLE